MEVLVNLDTLEVGAVWRRPRDHNTYRKVTALSHLNIRTGELLFDERLYGLPAEPVFVAEITTA